MTSQRLSIRSTQDVAAFAARKLRNYNTNSGYVTEGPPLSAESIVDIHEHLGAGDGEYPDEVEWFYGDMPSTMKFEFDGVVMDTAGYGPSQCAVQLRRALEHLAGGDGVHDTGFQYGNYGLHLRIVRQGDDVTLERVYQFQKTPVISEEEVPVDRRWPSRVGPPRLVAPWHAFVEGVQDYLLWHITEHVVEARWLLHSGLIKQWRREAGLSDECPDHPSQRDALER